MLDESERASSGRIVYLKSPADLHLLADKSIPDAIWWIIINKGRMYQEKSSRSSYTMIRLRGCAPATTSPF